MTTQLPSTFPSLSNVSATVSSEFGLARGVELGVVDEGSTNSSSSCHFANGRSVFVKIDVS